MSREKFLMLAVAFLFLLNLGTIGFLYVNRPRPPHELFRVIIQDLNLDEQQQIRFLTLRDQHRSTMDRLDQEFAGILENYLQLLNEPQSPLVRRDSLENALAAVEKQKAAVTLKHFREVKALCRPDQLQNFEQLVPALSRVLLPPKNQHPPRRKG
jgi:periplasmic protein CpxP/Spy